MKAKYLVAGKRCPSCGSNHDLCIVDAGMPTNAAYEFDCPVNRKSVRISLGADTDWGREIHGPIPAGSVETRLV